MWQNLKEKCLSGDFKSLARCISLVENEVEGYMSFLENLSESDNTTIIGITGPPGAGKSTLTDGLISELLSKEKKVAVVCVDPSSPFNFGAILGDRIRMSEWYNNKNVFIRSLASRGALGGLNFKIIEITSILKSAGFDYIILETVGVGQSEVEIAGIADQTIVVLVPESGDEIQNMKAGLMEIADVFVVNKSDRPGTDTFIKNLKLMLATSNNPETRQIPVVSVIASQKKGLDILTNMILNPTSFSKKQERKTMLLVEKAYQIIQQKRMKNVDKEKLYKEIKQNENTNIFKFASNYY